MALTGPSYLQDILRKYYAGESVEFCIRNLKNKGFNPNAIIDCGAYMGNWTRMVKKIFPSAKILMIEPQPDKQPLLGQVCSEFPGTVDYVKCLLGPERKEEVAFFEMESGSSIFEERTNHPRKIVTREMATLDDILHRRKIEKCELLKLDVQGYELEILKGAEQILKNAEVILLEVSFISFNRSAPLFHEVIEFMKVRGFLVYDVCPLPRWRDNTLFQADVFFVREDSIFRQIDFAAH
jgi:FkbM family methyltransferase